MTREEYEARIDSNLDLFKSATAYALDVMGQNWSERVATLAQKDLDLLDDTRAAVAYLVSRTYRHPRLLLTENMVRFIDYLIELNDRHSASTKTISAKDKLPMVAIVDMEELFSRTEDLIHYAIAGFRAEDYAPNTNGSGFIAKIFGK